jgi:hypothetical protein
MRSEEVQLSRWGCSASTASKGATERPKHLVDQDYYARTGKVVARCGYQLDYVDGQTLIAPGQYLSGRDVVESRLRSCAKCQRREVEAGSSMVTIPITVLKRLDAGEPWISVRDALDADVSQRLVG